MTAAADLLQPASAGDPLRPAPTHDWPDFTKFGEQVTDLLHAATDLLRRPDVPSKQVAWLEVLTGVLDLAIDDESMEPLFLTPAEADADLVLPDKPAEA
jgi:hypothetical protein